MNAQQSDHPTPAPVFGLSIVVPAYNEEPRLAATLQDILNYRQHEGIAAEIIVVDDGSTDNTAAVAEGFAISNRDVLVIRNPHQGKAYTVRTGMLAARGDVALFTDADGATPIAEANKLVQALRSGYDVAIGSREGSGASRQGEPWHRHVMGRVFNWIVRTLALPGINDTQCGFKAFSNPVSRDLFGHMQLYGSPSGSVQGALLTGFDVELLFMARKWGYRIIEVPINWRFGQRSKVNPVKDSWRNLCDVLRVRWNDWRGQYDR